MIRSLQKQFVTQNPETDPEKGKMLMLTLRLAIFITGPQLGQWTDLWE